MDLVICAQQAQAFREGRKRQHRLPRNAGSQAPVVVGATLSFAERGIYGKRTLLGRVRVTAIRCDALESISDDEIACEGFPNWTLLTHAWNDLHARSGFPWDINPDVWVIEFART